MQSIRPLKAVLSLSALLIGGLLLTACGDGVGVSPASATATTAAVPSSPSPPSSSPVTLTGTPATSVTVGKSYVFQPTVSAGAGAVTFQIQGKPAWAAFNTSTGALTGSPAVANEGTSAGITITASNGSSSASIGPFAIAVTAPSSTPPAPANGSANLSWTVPTENTDGTPLTDLAGYHIYYGTSAGSWTSTITVLDATQTSYVVAGLASGTYYFAIVAFDTAGDDSPQSNIASKTI
jgi:hypothetical protein